MTTYIDTNIYINIENNSIDVNDLSVKLSIDINKIFYSAAHLQETLEIQGVNQQERQERIKKRIDTIAKISELNYIYEDLNRDVFFLKEHPIVVLETITDVPNVQSIMKGFMNIITEDQKVAFRKELNIETEKINNYSHSEIINHLNTKLANLGGFTFLELLQQGASYHPDSKGFGLSNYIAGIFELLDMLGYWKDKPNDKSNYARFWDSNHVFHASYCDYFISDDKRTRAKAKVIYNIYGIKTKVISSKGEEEQINICDFQPI